MLASTGAFHALLIVIAFLLGSFPTGFLLVRFKTGQDIRTLGSGNIGATNVSRVLGKKWAIVAFAIDALKGYIPLLIIARWLDLPPFPITLIAFASVLGHCYCPWLHWNGGKGVAVAEGVLLALTPVGALVGLGVYLLAALTLKVSAIGSLAGLAASTITVALLQPQWLPLTLLIGALLIWRHQSNIKQLLDKRSQS